MTTTTSTDCTGCGRPADTDCHEYCPAGPTAVVTDTPPF